MFTTSFYLKITGMFGFTKRLHGSGGGKQVQQPLDELEDLVAAQFALAVHAVHKTNRHLKGSETAFKPYTSLCKTLLITPEEILLLRHHCK